MQIPFNKLYKTAETLASIEQEKLETGFYTRELLGHFKQLGFANPFLTNSCTTALEIIANVIGFENGDEVIVPSYGYVSTANAFAMAGAKLVYADSQENHPNVSLTTIKAVVTNRTKAVVLIHYGGLSTDLVEIASFCKNKGILLIEDAAHCIGANVNGKTLGTFGDFSAISFHQTKNVHCFNGGLLSVNNEQYVHAVQRFYAKGTDRMAYKNGKVDHYQWTGAGSSCDLSELNAGYLHFQLQHLEQITEKRRSTWNQYYEAFSDAAQSEKVNVVGRPANNIHKHNAHIFALLLDSLEDRIKLQNALNKKGIAAYEHYNPMHLSTYGKQFWSGNALPNAERLYDRLLRLPLFVEMDYAVVASSISTIKHSLRI